MDNSLVMGLWWIPDVEDVKVNGTLSFNKDGTASLTLADSFKDGSRSDSETPSHYPVILGDTRDGKEMTLFEVYVTTRAGHAIAHGKVIERGPALRAQRACVGAHLPLGGETPVTSVRLVFTHLADWVCGDLVFAEEKLSKDMLNLHVDYSYPAPFYFQGLDGTIGIGISLRQNDDLHSKAVSRQSFLQVVLDNPISFQDIRESKVKPFQYFLTFACGASAQLEELSFQVDDIGDQHGDQWIPRDIFEMIPDHEGDLSNHPYSWELLLPLSSIKERVEDVFSKWFAILGTAGSALDLYGSIFLGPPLYLETRFLYAAQALEVYHRRCSWFDGNDMPTFEWRKQWKKLQEAARRYEPELESWVEKRDFIFNNEKRLRQRLHDLVEYGDDQVRRILRPDFVDVATKTRHKLTHYDPKATGAEGEDLYWLSEEAIGLLEACILRDLGLTSTEVMAATSRTQRTRNLVARRK